MEDQQLRVTTSHLRMYLNKCKLIIINLNLKYAMPASCYGDMPPCYLTHFKVAAMFFSHQVSDYDIIKWLQDVILLIFH